MQLPAPKERHEFYSTIAQQCSASRTDRFEFYRQLRNYALFGTRDTTGTHYNKIGSTCETLCSFIYAPDAAKFSIHLGSSAPKEDLKKVPSLVHEVNDQWRMGRSHLTFGMALRWSLVFGCTLVKGMWKRGMFRSYMVEPHQFGVLREDISSLEDQEAFVHHYTTTKTQLWLELEGNPRREEIMKRVSTGAPTTDDERINASVSRLILSSGIASSSGSTAAGGAVEGGLQGMGGFVYDYSPKVEAELIDMMELYVWNDEINDYQMVTIAAPNVVIYDRKQPGVAGMSGFVKVSSGSTLYDYFWESSFVAPLTQLQEMRTERMNQISTILSKQADPPFALTGFGGIADEKLAALRRAGGQISSPMPGAKAENFAPNMPTNIFAEVDQIDKMFDDQAGIGHILQGKGESGVRSKGQADLLARLGSARPKQRAIVVEEAAEELATLLLASVQANSKQRFPIDGQENSQGIALSNFLAEQFTNDYEVRVDAHSSSPIFVEDQKNDAYQLLEARAIDRSTLLEIVSPPGLQLLQEKLKAIEAKEAQQAEREAQAAQAGGKK